MSRPSLENIRVLGDFATRYQWNLAFLTSPVGLTAPSAGLNLRCEASDLPAPKGSAISIEIRGQQVFQPGIYRVGGTLNITFIETVDNMVMDFLESWREMCWQSNTGVQEKNLDVKCEIQLTRLNRQDQPIKTDVVKGAYCLSFTKPQLGNANEAFKPTLTIQYDSYGSK